MDPAKLPIDKLAFFVASIIPGATAIYVYNVANPTAFHRFLVADELGYGAKVAIAVGLCFVIGNTLTTFVASGFGAVYGGAMPIITAKLPKWPDIPQTAPWRDPKWRKLAMKYLGQHAPADTTPILDDDFQVRLKTLRLLPEDQHLVARLELTQLRNKLAADDSDWRQWYIQINRRQKEESKPDFTGTFAEGLKANLEATGIYLLISLILVPGIRNWMIITFSVGWCLKIVAETFVVTKGSMDPWESWSDQIAFLSRKALPSAGLESPSNNSEE
jgi:hypothetical protein